MGHIHSMKLRVAKQILGITDSLSNSVPWQCAKQSLVLISQISKSCLTFAFGLEGKCHILFFYLHQSQKSLK